MLQSSNAPGHPPNDFPCDCSCLVVRRAIGFGFRVRRAAFTGFGFRVSVVISGQRTLYCTQGDLKFKEESRLPRHGLSTSRTWTMRTKFFETMRSATARWTATDFCSFPK